MNASSLGSFRGATWNIQGWQFKYRTTKNWMVLKNIDWVVVTETWLGQVAGGSTRPWEMDENLVSLISQKRDAGLAGRFHGGLGLMVSDSLLRSRAVKLLLHDDNAAWAAWQILDTVVIGVYLAPSLPSRDVEHILEKISEVVGKFRDKPLILCGDLNAKLMRRDGRFSDNSRGKLLREWLSDHGLNLLEPEGEYYNTTVCAREYNGWTDLFLVNDLALCRSTKIETSVEDCWQSDHLPVIWHGLTSPNVESPRVLKRDGWKWSALHNSAARVEYIAVMRKNLSEVRTEISHSLSNLITTSTEGERQAVVDHLYAEFIACMNHSADLCIPKMQRYDGSRARRYQSAEVRGLKADLKSTKRHLGLSRAQRTKECKRLFRLLLIAKRKETNDRWHNVFCAELDDIEVGEYLSTLKRIRRGRQKGTVPRADQSQVDNIARFFQAQCEPCVPSGTGGCPQQLLPCEAFQETDLGDPFLAPLDQQLLQAVDFTNVNRVVQRTSYGKASGHEGLSKERLGLTRRALRPNQYEGPNPAVEVIADLFEFCVTAGVCPSSWSQGMLIPLFKNKGNRDDLKNWRPITLQPYLRKLFDKLMVQFVREAGFSASQGGFQRSKSTLDQVAGLDHFLRIADRQKHPVYVVFLDIWAAYDTVNRNKLWPLLRERGVPERLVRLLSRMGQRSSGTVVKDGLQSLTVSFRAGVPQGGTIAPDLYNVYIDDPRASILLNRSSISFRGGFPRTSDGERVPAFGFADDIAIVTNCHETMETVLRICEEYSVEFDFRWKPSKCECISSEAEFRPFTLYGEEIARVETFSYLGVPFNHRGIDAMLLARKNVSRTIAASEAMASFGVNGYGFNPYRSVLAWKAFVRSCADYGLAVTHFPDRTMDTLEKAHCNSLRKLFGAHSRASREALYRLADAEPMTVRCQHLQLRNLTRLLRAASDRSALCSRWLSDALNDSGSMTRTIVDQNMFWPSQFEKWGRPRCGRQLRSLWTWEERASDAFNLPTRRPWLAVEYCHREPFLAVKEVRVDAKLQTAVRNQARQSWLTENARKSQNKLARDIPCPKGKSPLRLLRKCSMSERRHLLGWWLGLYPRRSEDLRCGLCSSLLPETGKREHVARCVAGERGRLYPLLETEADLREGLEEEGLLDESVEEQIVWRSSDDPITNTIWMACYMKKLNPGAMWGNSVFSSLADVTTKCLGRQREEENP